MSELRRLVALLALAGLLLTALALPAAAGRGPKRNEGWNTVATRDVRAALHCQPGALRPHTTPVLLVSGTSIDGSEWWTNGFQDALAAAGHKSCYVDLPGHALGDVQVSAEYIAHAIRRMSRGNTRQVSIYGWSQGGVLPRLALAVWPDLRDEVEDVVAIAGPQHGTAGNNCSASPCKPALWQQSVGSNLLRTLNSRGDETPGPTDWTTARTANDSVVIPVDTAVLEGATNVLVQDVCPGRTSDHVQIPFDSVSFALLLDALENEGPADPERLPAGVCDDLFAPGLDPAQVEADFAALLPTIINRFVGQEVADVPAEPPVRLFPR